MLPLTRRRSEHMSLVKQTQNPRDRCCKSEDMFQHTNFCLNMFQQWYIFPHSSVEVKMVFFFCKDICHCYFLINRLSRWSSLSWAANSFSVINEFDVPYGNQKFMTTFTGNHPWFLLRIIWIQSRLLHEVCIKYYHAFITHWSFKLSSLQTFSLTYCVLFLSLLCMLHARSLHAYLIWQKSGG
jgi:hypothetical protein